MKENKFIAINSLPVFGWNAILGGIFLILGYFFYAPQGPDSPLDRISFVGQICFFVAYFASQISIGYSISHFLKREKSLWETFFFGSVFLAIFIGVFGFLPILGEEFRKPWILFFLLANIWALYLDRFQLRHKISLPTWWDGIAILALLLAYLGSLSPHSFWDGLWYHLTSSRLWFENGRIYLPSDFPIALKAGFWDYHFSIGQVLLGSREGGGGLIAAQIFAQGAAFATVLFTFVVFRSVICTLGFSPFAALLALIGSELFLEAEFAKNDWAGVLGSMVLVAYGVQKRSFPWLALAAGFSFAAKFTSAFFVVPYLAIHLWQNRNQYTLLFKGGLIFVFTALPLLGRNFYFTGNPFFPALHQYFPSSYLGPSWDNIVAFSGNTFALANIVEKVLFLFRDSKAVFGILILPIAWIGFQSSKCALFLREQRVLFLCVIFSAIFFLFGSGPKAEWRLIGAALPLLAAFGAMGLEFAISKVPRQLKFVLLTGILFFFPIDWQALQRLDQDPAERIRQWTSGSSMAWVRLNGNQEKVATLNETRIYYLFPNFPLRVFDQPQLDTWLTKSTDIREMVTILRKAEIRYLILSAEFLDRYYNRRVCDEFFQISEKYPESVVFRSDLSRVLDLTKLPSTDSFAKPLAPAVQ